MENLIIYSIIFFIILIGLILLYISLNPVEIKEKPLEIKKNENFIGTTTAVAETFDISITGTEGEHYTKFSINNDKCLVIKQNCQFSFDRNLENCNILVVGGGGGGGIGHGGGGGAGAVINETITLNAGTYQIVIGNGGAPTSRESVAGVGEDTTVTYNQNNIYRAKGGGSGAGATDTRPGANGGSGGGNTGVHPTRSTFVLTNIPSRSFGNNGGLGTGQRGNSSYGGGGGGGAGAQGGDARLDGNRTIAGNGGNGVNLSSIFTGIVGHNGWFGGGGGGGAAQLGISAGNGGLGGGGNGGYSGIGNNGLTNTGGGGGGGCFYSNWTDARGGNGGSGVVIIRYRPVVIQPDPSQGRVASTLNFNSITEQEAKEFTTKKTEPVNDAPFASVSTPTDRLGGGFNQRATTFSLYPELIRVVDFNVYYSSYDTSMTVANFMPTPTFLFGAPSFEPAVNYTSAYFRPRRYTPATGEFIDRTNALDINIINNGITYNNITLLDSNNQPTTNLQTLRGEYVGIKCPTKSNLISYSFTANLAFENLAPGAWVVLGRDKSITESKLTYKLISQSPKVNNDFERQPWSIYYNNAQTKRCYIRDNRDSFDEYLFIFPKLASTDIRANINYGHQLIFKEIKLHSIAPDNIER